MAREPSEIPGYEGDLSGLVSSPAGRVRGLAGRGPRRLIVRADDDSGSGLTARGSG